MNARVRGPVWAVLIVAGAAAVVLGLLAGNPAAAVIAGIVAGVVWIGWGTYSSWHWSVRRRIAEHLGPGWRDAEVVTHPVRTAERADLQVALNFLHGERGAGEYRFGLPTAWPYDEVDAGAGYDISNLILTNVDPKPIRWTSVPRSKTEEIDCAENALYLVRLAERPVAVAVQGRIDQTSARASLHILALDRATARAALRELLALAREKSVYRGAVISVDRQDRKGQDYAVTFHDLTPPPRDAIILPEDVLRAVERNVLGFFRHADDLRQAGQGVRHGVLLHGPPGTGKTLVTRYLVGQAQPATVLLLTGRQYANLGATCRLARLLEPSLVVLEDVDLIAGDRRRNPHKPLLHELMDEMDGLSSAAHVVFLLTTNRPEVLEEALSSRPGRVDQAIYFPLPDLESRRRLFAQFGRGLSLSAVALDPLLARTDGASPAFLKELFRRAALLALERGARGKPIPVGDDDIDRALREILLSGGELTRHFLGFPSRSGVEDQNA